MKRERKIIKERKGKLQKKKVKSFLEIEDAESRDESRSPLNRFVVSSGACRISHQHLSQRMKRLDEWSAKHLPQLRKTRTG